MDIGLFPLFLHACLKLKERVSESLSPSWVWGSVTKLKVRVCHQVECEGLSPSWRWGSVTKLKVRVCPVRRNHHHHDMAVVAASHKDICHHILVIIAIIVVVVVIVVAIIIIALSITRRNNIIPIYYSLLNSSTYLPGAPDRWRHSLPPWCPSSMTSFPTSVVSLIDDVIQVCLTI